MKWIQKDGSFIESGTSQETKLELNDIATLVGEDYHINVKTFEPKLYFHLQNDVLFYTLQYQMEQTLSNFRIMLLKAEPANGETLFDYFFMIKNCPVS